MKRFIIVLFILLTFCGCGQKESFEKPVKLYYPRSQISYGSETASITYETIEALGLSNEVILQNYLGGPGADTASQPFPSNVTLTLLKIADNQASIVLSDNYAKLNGLELSIANGCLAKTVMELCNVSSVMIQCESSVLAGSPSIRIDESDLLVFDDSTGPTEPTKSLDISTTE